MAGKVELLAVAGYIPPMGRKTYVPDACFAHKSKFPLHGIDTCPDKSLQQSLAACRAVKVLG
jgi:hypothetical protein